jgi:hypothetical protein
MSLWSLVPSSKSPSYPDRPSRSSFTLNTRSLRLPSSIRAVTKSEVNPFIPMPTNLPFLISPFLLQPLPNEGPLPPLPSEGHSPLTRSESPPLLPSSHSNPNSMRPRTHSSHPPRSNSHWAIELVHPVNSLNFRVQPVKATLTPPAGQSYRLSRPGNKPDAWCR